MMWGSLWDSVREDELDPKEYVELVVKNIATEHDETIVASILGRASTAMNYYLSEPPAVAGGLTGHLRTTSDAIRASQCRLITIFNHRLPQVVLTCGRGLRMC